MEKRKLLSALQLLKDTEKQESLMVFEHSGFINIHEKRELDSIKYDELMKKNKIKVKIRKN